jgi:hypothetical protein
LVANNTKITDKEFIDLWEKHYSITEMAKETGLNIRSLNHRRRRLEEKLGKPFVPKAQQSTSLKYTEVAETKRLKGKERAELGILNGTVIVFSDAHYWPGIRTTAHKALLWAIESFQPQAVIANGDIFDGASISRHSPIMWTHSPSVIQELQACQACMGEIEEMAKKARHNVRLVWPYGNHDARFASRLAQVASEYANVNGTSLKDHFPTWEPCWSAWINDSTIVKHRFKNGVHATHNNTVNSGKNIVTGHLHSLKVTPFADYNGNRFGVDTGTLAETNGPQFMDYMEDGPANWRSGFAVLTFKDGRLLWPELVHKWDEDLVEFRGEVINVGGY